MTPTKKGSTVHEFLDALAAVIADQRAGTREALADLRRDTALRFWLAPTS
jgi:hypothetical protein